MSYSRIIELYENQRYAPPAGWSPSSLLPTDRERFSLADGRASWAELAEAEAGLLSFGWQWEEDAKAALPGATAVSAPTAEAAAADKGKGKPAKPTSAAGSGGAQPALPHWHLDRTCANTDGDGWSYCTNFGSYTGGAGGGGSGVKGMMHFVRRRRYWRKQVFTAVAGACSPGSCGNCDLQEVDRLSSLLMQALAAASLYEHGTKEYSLTEPQCNALKSCMMTALLAPLPPEYGHNKKLLLARHAELQEEAAKARAKMEAEGASGDGANLPPAPPSPDPLARPHEAHLVCRGAHRLLSVPQLIDHRLQAWAEQCNHSVGDGVKRRMQSLLRGDGPRDPLDVEREREGRAHILPPLSEAAPAPASSFVSSLPLSSSPLDYLVLRMNELADSFFPRAERSQLAKLAICKLDIFGEFHCMHQLAQEQGLAEGQGEVVLHESVCPFAEQTCNNGGCNDLFSRKWAAKHDGVCGHKVVPCARQCGDSFPRRQMDMHMDRVCALRPAECPFRHLGCVCSGLTVREVPAHMDAAVQSHLLLAVGRLQEQQEVIVGLNRKVSELQSRVSDHCGQIAAAAAAITANAALEAEHHRELAALEGRVNRRVGDAKSAVQSEVASLRSWVQGRLPK